jgi:hypothetical protein
MKSRHADPENSMDRGYITDENPVGNSTMLEK